MSEKGPVYGIELITELPLGVGGMVQAMPSRNDLEQVCKINERTAAGYEVLLSHYQRLKKELEVCESFYHLAVKERDFERMLVSALKEDLKAEREAIATEVQSFAKQNGYPWKVRMAFNVAAARIRNKTKGDQ